ncbi:MAG: hypothetical protein AW06_001550 [Candidatus Accumulibacter cognatus]|uniref:Uncharacterized protein n=1 Tax=Candidatus Accumulibacter cognatus TaxID=2954383 RepID=A0A080MJA1_9PROT|nr:MAG: hypothetical protein AW06_001550 [Candidatus Accumulibacter cognatus]
MACESTTWERPDTVRGAEKLPKLAVGPPEKNWQFHHSEGIKIEFTLSGQTGSLGNHLEICHK